MERQEDWGLCNLYYADLQIMPTCTDRSQLSAVPIAKTSA
uniref:Uncharacterized protein n=1 Tax=Rhizobium rhizogenes TaxID=359 RepID=A0A7S5DQA2_RHIRH|nr:hypothetical protein pC5.8a_132 [Rhizobium rhizogenes]